MGVQDAILTLFVLKHFGPRWAHLSSSVTCAPICNMRSLCSTREKQKWLTSLYKIIKLMYISLWRVNFNLWKKFNLFSFFSPINICRETLSQWNFSKRSFALRLSWTCGLIPLDKSRFKFFPRKVPQALLFPKKIPVKNKNKNKLLLHLLLVYKRHSSATLLKSVLLIHNFLFNESQECTMHL